MDHATDSGSQWSTHGDRYGAINQQRIEQTDAGMVTDGKWLLYVASGGEGQGLDIWKMDYTNLSAPPVNITQKSGDQTEPAWSPDGSLIVYTDYSRSDGVPALEIMDADGGNKQRILSDYGETSAAWYPTSDRLLFVRNDRGYKVLYTYKRPAFDQAEKVDPNSPFGQLGIVEDPAISEMAIGLPILRLIQG